MMDAKNYEYLSKKVERYERLDKLKDLLNSVQGLLVRDCDIQIQLNVDRMDCLCLKEKLPMGIKIDEHEELMREIKDNLIDAIGMKIIEINDKMEEL